MVRKQFRNHCPQSVTQQLDRSVESPLARPRLARSLLGALLTAWTFGSLASCSPRPQRQFRIMDPALQPLVPPDARGLARVRVDQLRATEFYRHCELTWGQPPLAPLYHRFGLPLQVDVWQLVLVATPSGSLLLVRGRFGPSGLEPGRDLFPGPRLRYRTHTLIEANGLAIGFLNPTTLVAGPLALVGRTLDWSNSSSSLPPALRAAITHVDPQSHVWFVATACQGESEPVLANCGSNSEKPSLAADLAVAPTNLRISVWMDPPWGDGAAPQQQSSEQALRQRGDRIPDWFRLARWQAKRLDGSGLRAQGLIPQQRWEAFWEELIGYLLAWTGPGRSRASKPSQSVLSYQ